MNTIFLDKFEGQLINELLKLCTSYNMLNGQLLITDDFNDLWNKHAPEYVADAVKEIKDYPSVALAWAAYLGMGVANGWDKNFEATKNAEYQSYYGPRGFDDMDEHIVGNILGYAINGPEANRIRQVLQSCAQLAEDLIRREKIEPQSEMAFHIYARAVKALFKIGASMELKRLGYKFEAMPIGEA